MSYSDQKANFPLPAYGLGEKRLQLRKTGDASPHLLSGSERQTRNTALSLLVLAKPNSKYQKPR